MNKIIHIRLRGYALRKFWEYRYELIDNGVPMSDSLKTLARNLLPKRYQVPAKYLYNAMRGTLEEEMKILGLLVRYHDQVIDVGGNRGVYAYRLWKLGAVIDVFEPNPACSSVLIAWAIGKPGVHVHSVALSNLNGTATLHIPIDEEGVMHDASASIEHTDFAHVRSQLVNLNTLDSYGFQNVQLIKIDVEGHEYSVIEGAEITLASSKPALLVEIEQRHNSRPINEVFEKILSLDYQGYFMMRGVLTALDKFDLTRHQTMENFGGAKMEYISNFLFLHRDRLADGEYDALVNGQLLK